MTVHICAPAPVVVKLRRLYCPTCNRRTYSVISFYEWYGPDDTCLNCGERFNEDGRAPRPFMRGWRKDSIAAAKRHYRRFRARPASEMPRVVPPADEAGTASVKPEE